LNKTSDQLCGKKNVKRIIVCNGGSTWHVARCLDPHRSNMCPGQLFLARIELAILSAGSKQHVISLAREHADGRRVYT
jgi:hypothetical protein